jgi:trans-AT polyketide synthase/acyltransferase/oxidoreductase domain-containing protein
VADVWAETVKFYTERLHDTAKIERAEQKPKLKMSLVFRWHLSKSSGWANRGENDHKMDYQIWCGPVIGAFNAFISGTLLDSTMIPVHRAGQLARAARDLLH